MLHVDYVGLLKHNKAPATVTAARRACVGV